MIEFVPEESVSVLLLYTSISYKINTPKPYNELQYPPSSPQLPYLNQKSHSLTDHAWIQDPNTIGNRYYSFNTILETSL